MYSKPVPVVFGRWRTMDDIIFLAWLLLYLIFGSKEYRTFWGGETVIQCTLGLGSWESPKPDFFEKLQQKLDSILLIPVCVEFRVGKRVSYVCANVSVYKGSWLGVFFFFLNIYLFGFCSRSQLWYIGSLVVQTLSCYMWDLFLWPGIEPEPPALGTWGLSHWTTRVVPLDEFLMYLWGGWQSPCLTPVPSSSASPP